MRHKNTEKLSDVLAKALKQNHLNERLYQTKVINSWPVVLGATIMQYTSNIYFKHKKLYVHLSSAVLRHELFLSREGIKNSLNNHVGAQIVEEIVFL